MPRPTAMDWLRQAVAARSATFLELECGRTRTSTIRGRDDFRKLLAEQESRSCDRL